MTIKLRSYQEECVEKFISDARKYPNDNLLAALPTGSGKSIILGALCKRIANAGKRVLVLARSKELLVQNNSAYCKVDPKGIERSGVYSAGLGIRQTDQQVTFAGIQSICNRGEELGKIDAVLIDEAHQISFEQNSQYQTLFRVLGETSPQCRHFGVTATPFRMDGVIHGGRRSLFDRMSYVVPLSLMFDEGTLTRPVTLPSTSCDMSGVRITAGEYNQSQAQSAFLSYWAKNNKTAEIVATANSRDRKSCVVFCSGVAHAELVKAELEALGESVACVTGETLPLIREVMLEQFKNRKKRWIVNVDVLTVGWDAPCVDYIVMARATQSAGLFSQIIGRGLRKYPNKTECYVTDFGGCIDRFGPIDSPTFGEGFIKEPSGVEGEPPKRVCPQCYAIFAAGKKVCPECGIVLPEKEKTMISTKQAITVKTTKHTVLDETYKIWQGKEMPDGSVKPNTLLVQYRLKVEDDAEIGKSKKWAREWICLEHPDGYAKDKAREWWSKRSNTMPPETLMEAIELIDAGALAKTIEISLRPDGKFDKIVGHELTDKPVDYSLEDIPF